MMQFGKLHIRWPIKLIALVLITQVMVLGQLSHLHPLFALNTRPTTTSLSAPCPKVEIQSKTTQQLCQNNLCASLNSILAGIAFFFSKRASHAQLDYTTQYKLLIYSIFKPPKQ